MPDDVSIIIAGQSFGGWQDVRVTRGAERVPSSFEIGATERFPGQIKAVAIAAGSACQVKIGPDLVLTGYVDRVMPTLSGERHAVRIQGRSKIEDIVDCSVTPDIIDGMQVATSSLLDLASTISKPFGIAVRSLTGDNVPVGTPTGEPLLFNVMLSETGYEVIERVARYSQVLVYDDVDGALLLARAGGVGANTMASGFAQGVNIQEATGTLSMDQRYSVYQPMLMSFNQWGAQGVGGMQFPAVKDLGVPRYRPLVVISEQFEYGQSFAEQRAQWEAARRYGRSQAVRLVCDNWRDKAGTLWQPNAYASVSIPLLKLAPTDPWIISEVTFARDADRGTTAELTLMPKQAFTQEPNILMPFLWYQPDGSTPPGGVPGGAPT